MADKPIPEKPADTGDLHARHKHPILADQEVDEARTAALKKAKAARVKAAKEAIEKEETQRLLLEEGLTSGGPLDEIVELTLNLAVNQPYLMLDGRKYSHGHSYKVKRCVANDLLYMEYKGHEQEAARLGVDRFQFYQQKRANEIAKVGGAHQQVRRWVT